MNVRCYLTADRRLTLNTIAEYGVRSDAVSADIAYLFSYGLIRRYAGRYVLTTEGKKQHRRANASLSKSTGGETSYSAHY